MVPSISVIVPVRERTADLLLSKLQNLGDGDFRDFEVIVVDNHSSVKMADHIVPGKYPFSVRCLRFDDFIDNVPIVLHLEILWREMHCHLFRLLT